MATSLERSAQEVVADNSQAVIWRFLLDSEAIMRGRCRQIIRSPEDAEDAYSELRIRLFQQLRREPQRLASIDNIPAWLRRVTSNHCIDRLRRTWPTCSLDQSDLVLSSTTSTQAGPEHSAYISELLDALSLALLRLPAGLCEALQYRCVSGVEYAEMACALGISEPNARKRVQLARRQLKGSLRVFDISVEQ